MAAQEHFGIIDDHHSAEAASLDLPACLCKIKGDLLLIEMAVHEVCPCAYVLVSVCVRLSSHGTHQQTHQRLMDSIGVR